MKEIIERGATSQLKRVFIGDSASPIGEGYDGLAFDTPGLEIWIQVEKSANPTIFKSSDATIEDLLGGTGVYQAPTDVFHVRFKQVSVDGISPGLYELHFHDDWFAAANGRNLVGAVRVVGGTAIVCPFEFQLVDPVAFAGGPSAAAIGLGVWVNPARTLTSFGTLVADLAAGVWSFAGFTSLAVTTFGGWLYSTIVALRTLILSGKIAVVSPLAPDGSRMDLVWGDAYTVANGNAFTFRFTGKPSIEDLDCILGFGLKGSSALFTLAPVDSHFSTDPEEEQWVTFEMSKVNCEKLPIDDKAYFSFTIVYINNDEDEEPSTIKKGPVYVDRKWAA